ncbi:MAG TPA: DUF1573 domain-containing protein, partial [bacterium]|nr:DUF1573 domain-containing protein [bacterium]
MKVLFRFWFAFLLLLAFCSATAQAQVILKPKFYQFGKVVPGKAYHLKVKITNPTTQTISLWNLHADCDCTTAHIALAVLKPKTSTTMTVDFHPMEGENGFKNLAVSFQVYSQDNKKAMQRNTEKFLFNADIHSPYTYNPPTLDGGLVFYGHPKEMHGTLKLDHKTYPHWKPGQSPTPAGGLQVQVKPMATPGLFDVQLSAPETLSVGTYTGAVTLVGQGEEDPSFHYPFRLVVATLWSIVPQRLDFGNLGDPKMAEHQQQT